uniref:Uncharacterized protein n=1 Tax=Tetranychus urticae TaxID=32264 RepID=T1K4K0_TETUR
MAQRQVLRRRLCYNTPSNRRKIIFYFKLQFISNSLIFNFNFHQFQNSRWKASIPLSKEARNLCSLW